MDIFEYKKQLEQKLETVNAIIRDMGVGNTTGNRRGRPSGSTVAKNGRRKGRRKMSAARRAALSVAAKARWAKIKKAGKNKL